MPSFRYAATAVFWGATVAYIGFGIVGVVFGPIELASLVPHDATTYSQLRFLKACELAVGVSFWADGDAEANWRNINNGARRWWRVIVSRRGCAVRLNHIGAGVGA